MQKIKHELNYNEFKESLKNESNEAKIFYQSIEDYQGIINTIKDERIKQKLSQRDLAKMVNIKQSQIGRIETFKICPLLTTITKLTIALGLTIKIDNEYIYKAKPNKEYIVYYLNKPNNDIYPLEDKIDDNNFLNHKGDALYAKC